MDCVKYEAIPSSDFESDLTVLEQVFVESTALKSRLLGLTPFLRMVAITQEIMSSISSKVDAPKKQTNTKSMDKIKPYVFEDHEDIPLVHDSDDDYDPPVTRWHGAGTVFGHHEPVWECEYCGSEDCSKINCDNFNA